MTLEVYRVADRIWLQYSKYKRCKLELSHVAAALSEVAVALFEALSLQKRQDRRYISFPVTSPHASVPQRAPRNPFDYRASRLCTFCGRRVRNHWVAQQTGGTVYEVAYGNLSRGQQLYLLLQNKLKCSSLCAQKGEGHLAMPQQGSSQPGPEKVAEAGPGGGDRKSVV